MFFQFFSIIFHSSQIVDFLHAVSIFFSCLFLYACVCISAGVCFTFHVFHIFAIYFCGTVVYTSIFSSGLFRCSSFHRSLFFFAFAVLRFLCSLLKFLVPSLFSSWRKRWLTIWTVSFSQIISLPTSLTLWRYYWYPFSVYSIAFPLIRFPDVLLQKNFLY